MRNQNKTTYKAARAAAGDEGKPWMLINDAASGLIGPRCSNYIHCSLEAADPHSQRCYNLIHLESTRSSAHNGVTQMSRLL